MTALLTVLAVMNGFENEVQTRIAGTDAHVLLLGRRRRRASTDADALAALVARRPGVEGVAPFTYAKAIVFREGLTEGIIVKGVDLRAGARRDHAWRSNISPAARLDPDARADGRARASCSAASWRRGCAARVGDRVVLASLQRERRRSPFGFAPRLRQFRVVGVFTSGPLHVRLEPGLHLDPGLAGLLPARGRGHRHRGPHHRHVRRAAGGARAARGGAGAGAARQQLDRAEPRTSSRG